jgi:hypothetical protein
MSDYEERELDRIEAYERDVDEAEIAEQMADEDRSALFVIPVRCLVNGHEFEMYRGISYCNQCGQDQYDEVTTSGVRHGMG